MKKKIANTKEICNTVFFCKIRKARHSNKFANISNEHVALKIIFPISVQINHRGLRACKIL